MKITRPDKNTKVTTFESIQEMVNHIKTAPVNKVFENRWSLMSTAKEKHSSNFYGTETFDEALDLLTHGWVDKSKELEQKFTDRVKKESNQVMRQKSVYDVVGGNASVARYLQGVPTNMIRQVRTPVKQKVLTVNYNISFGCKTTAKEILDNAIDCLSYVKKLEDSGTRVNLNVYLITDYDGLTFGYVSPVKKSGERLSIAKMAFTLCHASMLRRILVACMERDQEVTSGFVDGYGYPVKNKTKLKQIIPDAEFFN